jgi:hypothetical protein
MTQEQMKMAVQNDAAGVQSEDVLETEWLGYKYRLW